MIFDGFVGIDWSGGKQRFQKGIEVALCRPGAGAPRRIDPPEGRWSRAALFDWMAPRLIRERLLVGLDFSFTFPFVDRDAYFPGIPGAPRNARALWALVDRTCADVPGFYGGAFAERAPWSAYFFRAKGQKGRRFDRRHKRVEEACAAAGLGHPESVFHLIGAKQVGRGSLAGMRFLHALDRQVDGLTIWPMDDDRGGSVVVEIFPRAFIARAGGGSAKLREAATLNPVLRQYGAPGFRGDAPLDDNRTDALVTAAALRALAGDPALWRPRAMTARVRRTEGWIFGIGDP